MRHSFERVWSSLKNLLLNLCNTPLVWMRYLIKRKHYCWIVLKKIFKWELSKWRLGGSDQGEEYTCQILLLKKKYNLRNVHFQILRQSNIIWTYGILYARGTLLKEYGRPWRIWCWNCLTPPWYEWDIWLNENIIVGLYWKHFFKWELSKWRLGGSDQGEEYTCQILLLKKNVIWGMCIFKS